MAKKAARLNPVAKYAHQFNRCAPHVDRKKQQQKGIVKHKKREVFHLPLCIA